MLSILKVSRPSVDADVMSFYSRSRRQRGSQPSDLNITRGVKVARRLFSCVQDAGHREEAVDVGDGAEAPPELATMLTVS